MSLQRNTPSAVILDLLRSSRGRERSARALIRAGALFGFTENAIRVNLSRLANKGRIESPARGRYRLTRQTDALNEFVERWRLGEARVRPWTPGRWLFAHPPSPEGPSERSVWVLDALGFRAVRPGLLARPDNLALTLAELRALAGEVGLDADVLLLAGEPEGGPVPNGWLTHWRPAALDAAYADGATRLAESSARLPDLPRNEAQLECFSLGGEMIHRLAKDPLLPAEFVDAAARAALCEAMLRYDVQGQQYWKTDAEDALRRMPRPQLEAAAPQTAPN